MAVDASCWRIHWSAAHIDSHQVEGSIPQVFSGNSVYLLRHPIGGAGAFAHAVDSANINLVIAEADRQNDINVGEACFGTEVEAISSDGGHKWRRQNNGVFAETNISENVVGLIVLRRPDSRKPIPHYTMLLYMNDKHVGYLPAIQAAFPIQRVIHYNMRPNAEYF